MKIELALRERDMVLAALRLYQSFLAEGWGISPQFQMIAGEHGEPLDEDEIDTLCEEKINC